MVGYTPEKETQLFASEQALAGAVSGAVSRALFQPFDVLKIRFQVRVHCIYLVEINTTCHSKFNFSKNLALKSRVFTVLIL